MSTAGMGFKSVARRKPLYTALKNTLAVSAGLSITLISLADTTNTEWSCQPSENGEWACEEKPREGRVYPRPKHTAATPSTVSPEEPRVKLTSNLDWVPYEQLTEEEKKLALPACCGAYIEPPRTYEGADLLPSEAPLKISANATEAQGETATLSGDVQVSQGYRQVRSNRAIVDSENRTVDLEGNITYREPGILLNAEKAFVNLDTGQLDVHNVTYLLHESNSRGRAKLLTRPTEDTIYIDNAVYTTCEPGNNSWSLKASSVEIEKEQYFATARNARFYVKDWPVLYVPWIRYPLSDNRVSGLLFPNVLTGGTNGFDFAQPIYLNLAPNYDATVTPRFIQKRGDMAEGEFRHLSRITETALSGGYLWDDEGGSDSDSRYKGEDRWSRKVTHRGGFGQSWSTLIDYTDVSDVDYFQDIDNSTLDLRSASYLNQQFRAGYHIPNWDFFIQRQQFKTLIPDGPEQYRQMPRVDANGHYRLGASDFLLTLKQSVVSFDHKNDDILSFGSPLTIDDKNTIVTGNRLRGDYSLVWDKDWVWGYIKPGMTAKYITYDLNDPLQGYSDKSPHVFVPVATVDSGLYFERDANWFNDSILTLEPRLYYVYAGYENQSDMPDFDTSLVTFDYYQLFREDRFIGGDRIGDTDQVTLGLTSRLIDNETGWETFRFSIGQVYYFKDRRVTLDTSQSSELSKDSSDIAVLLAGRFNRHWRYQADVIAEDKDGNISRGNISLRYNNLENGVFNLSYRYTGRDEYLVSNAIEGSDINQIDTSFALPFNDNWSILGRYNYDLESNEELETFAGFEYASCCWSFTLVARRWIERVTNVNTNADNLEHENGVFFQIQFRGLAGTGSRVENILRDGVYGYKQDY